MRNLLLRYYNALQLGIGTMQAYLRRCEEMERTCAEFERISKRLRASVANPI